MARKVASFRLDTELLDWVAQYASSRGASQGTVVESALRSFKEESERGVPDLPVADSPEARVRRAMKAAPVRPARKLSPPDPAMLARQRRLNGGR